MGFELFIPGNNTSMFARLPDPCLKLTPAGTLSLNAAALEALKLSEPCRAVLMFDRDMGQIGLRAPGRNEANTIMFSQQKNSLSRRSQVATFCRVFGIDREKAMGQYGLSFDERTRLWICQLPDGSWQRPEAPRTRLLANRVESKRSEVAS